MRALNKEKEASRIFYFMLSPLQVSKKKVCRFPIKTIYKE